MAISMATSLSGHQDIMANPGCPGLGVADHLRKRGRFLMSPWLYFFVAPKKRKKKHNNRNPPMLLTAPVAAALELYTKQLTRDIWIQNTAPCCEALELGTLQHCLGSQKELVTLYVGRKKEIGTE